MLGSAGTERSSVERMTEQHLVVRAFITTTQTDSCHNSLAIGLDRYRDNVRDV